MLYPTVIADNFFNDPNKVKSFGLNLKKQKDPNNTYPGTRTKSLHEIDASFFNYLGIKILSVLYPYEFEKLSFKATMFFQEVSSKFEEGWVHRDNGLITSIIYLSDHKNCGTSICQSKNAYSNVINVKEKHQYFKNPEKFNVTKIRELNNNQFEETININSKYNRMISFDSNHLHKANSFKDDKINENRLTLITFFDKISYNGDKRIKYPLDEARKRD